MKQLFHMDFYFCAFVYTKALLAKERKDAVIPLSTTLTLIDKTPNLC